MDAEAPGLWTPLQATLVSSALYMAFLILLICQGRRSLSSNTSIAVQLEILTLLTLLFFVVAPQRLIVETPLPQTMMALLSLALYSGCLACYNYGALGSWHAAFLLLHLLLPLTIPFFVFIFLFEAVEFYTPLKLFFFNHNFVAYLFVAIVLALVLIFIPTLLLRAWRCSGLEDGSLRRRLEALCQSASFHHGGIYIWQAMAHHPNAAIIGVMAPWRYLLFSPELLMALPPESVEAVLAHEIGHSKRHHLLMYPFVLLGMAVASALAVQLLTPAVVAFVNLGYRSYPSKLWEWVPPPLIFFIFAATTALYFRYLFGCFSRLCEREADLYGMTLGLSNRQIAIALDDLAYAAGLPLDTPSWHHYSIRTRIAFLLAADAATPYNHHRRLIAFLAIYGIFLIIAVGLLINFF